MKRSIRTPLLAVPLLVLATLLAACTTPAGPQPPAPAIATIRYDGPAGEVPAGEYVEVGTVRLYPFQWPGQANVTLTAFAPLVVDGQQCYYTNISVQGRAVQGATTTSLVLLPNEDWTFRGKVFEPLLPLDVGNGPITFEITKVTVDATGGDEGLVCDP
ncbi:hypothetical protein [Dermatobacter hominis]|uniref:hypothetical protein n=1 Tax=Dermatobacter hominis TaxID=2884263 RepID=UPI001D10B5A8|nr:hypothetical protein [Dermatobacter hominis]UDY34948.1 hypothetical protein LH044_16615 [Dermatobacter hominis]